jgi:hypothetical protein
MGGADVRWDGVAGPIWGDAFVRGRAVVMRVDFVSFAELVVDVGALAGRLSLLTLSGQG